MLLMTAAKKASKANWPFLKWAPIIVAAVAGILWAGPRVDPLVAPAATNVQMVADSSYDDDTLIMLTADVHRGCRFTYLRMTTWGKLNDSPYTGLSIVGNHLLTQDPFSLLLVIPKGSQVEPGARLVFHCPITGWFWRSYVPVTPPGNIPVKS